MHALITKKRHRNATINSLFITIKANVPPVLVPAQVKIVVERMVEKSMISVVISGDNNQR